MLRPLWNGPAGHGALTHCPGLALVHTPPLLLLEVNSGALEPGVHVVSFSNTESRAGLFPG